MVALLEELPARKRQPNLLLAAVRFLAGIQPDYAAFRAVVLGRRDEVVATMLARRTQTNEPARCATLLPALAALDGPLALLEVGASAGLCLYPDRYGYHYRRADSEDVRLPGSPELTCDVRDPAPLPDRKPTVVWRAGHRPEPARRRRPGRPALARVPRVAGPAGPGRAARGGRRDRARGPAADRARRSRRGAPRARRAGAARGQARRPPLRRPDLPALGPARGVRPGRRRARCRAGSPTSPPPSSPISRSRPRPTCPYLRPAPSRSGGPRRARAAGLGRRARHVAAVAVGERARLTSGDRFGFRSFSWKAVRPGL